MAVIKISRNEIPDGGCKIVEVGEQLRVAVFRVGSGVRRSTTGVFTAVLP